MTSHASVCSISYTFLTHSYVIFFTCKVEKLLLTRANLFNIFNLYLISIKVLHLSCLLLMSSFDGRFSVQNTVSLASEGIEASWGGHVHAHQPQSFRFKHLSFCCSIVGLLDHRAEVRLVEHVACVCSPQIWNRRIHASHRRLKLRSLALLCQVISEGNLQIFVPDYHVAETEGEVDVFVLESNQVDDCSEDRIKSVPDNVFTHLASIGDRHGIGVNHAVALLEDGLACARGLFLPLVPDQVLLNDRVHDEARSTREKRSYWK